MLFSQSWKAFKVLKRHPHGHPDPGTGELGEHQGCDGSPTSKVRQSNSPALQSWHLGTLKQSCISAVLKCDTFSEQQWEILSLKGFCTNIKEPKSIVQFLAPSADYPFIP